MRLTQKEGRRQWLRSTGNVAILLGIFLLGLNLGNGNLSLHRNQPVTQGLPNKLDYSSVDKVYRSLKENYDGQLNAGQLEDGLKHGLATATKDPYTVYFTAAEAKEFNDQLNNSFSGIGAQLGQDSDGNLEVIAPIDGLPADKAGLKAKDIIASINGNSTTGLSVDEAVTKIRGKKGTKVTLQIVRNKTQPLELTITRDDIKLPSVKTKTLDGNIGYLQINSFANDTTDLTRKAAEKFKNDQVKGLILDLRNNPGGLLDSAVDVSSLWLPTGQNILQERRGGHTVVQSYVAQGNAILDGIPTVILINSGSASASEIVTGALHDNKAAYVIGEKSYGKGVVQQVICIGSNAAADSNDQRASNGARNADGSCPADELKVTVASWYRPNGQNINKKGITPDKTVKISDDDAKADKDPQLEAAQAYLTK